MLHGQVCTAERRELPYSLSGSCHIVKDPHPYAMKPAVYPPLICTTSGAEHPSYDQSGLSQCTDASGCYTAPKHTRTHIPLFVPQGQACASLYSCRYCTGVVLPVLLAPWLERSCSASPASIYSYTYCLACKFLYAVPAQVHSTYMKSTCERCVGRKVQGVGARCYLRYYS